MASPNDMEGWHKLPHELRLEILKFALTPPIKLPIPSEVQPDDCVKTCLQVWNRKPRNLARDLLLVNRQFHDNVQRIIKFMPEVYHLDVMVVKDYGLWTTWYLPKLPEFTCIDEVTVTFRIFQSNDNLQKYFKNYLEYASRWTHAMRDIHNLFARLIGIGPGFFLKRDLRKFVIKKMDVNVLSATDAVTHTGLWRREGKTPKVMYRKFGPEGSVPQRTDEQLAESIVLLFKHISRPTSKLYHPMALYHRNLEEDIVLRLNGVESQRLDFERIIKDMEYHGSTADQMMRLKETQEKREEMKQRFERQRQRARHGNTRCTIR